MMKQMKLHSPKNRYQNNLKLMKGSEFVFDYVQLHCLRNARILSNSGPHFPTFELNTERYGVFISFINKYSWEGINFLSEKDDWKNSRKIA